MIGKNDFDFVQRKISNHFFAIEKVCKITHQKIVSKNQDKRQAEQTNQNDQKNVFVKF